MFKYGGSHFMIKFKSSLNDLFGIVFSFYITILRVADGAYKIFGNVVLDKNITARISDQPV